MDGRHAQVLQGLQAVAGKDRLVPVLGKHVLQERKVLGNIVNEEYLEGKGGLPARGRRGCMLQVIVSGRLLSSGK